jgi:hypothetical protein
MGGFFNYIRLQSTGGGFGSLVFPFPPLWPASFGLLACLDFGPCPLFLLSRPFLGAFLFLKVWQGFITPPFWKINQNCLRNMVWASVLSPNFFSLKSPGFFSFWCTNEKNFIAKRNEEHNPKGLRAENCTHNQRKILNFFLKKIQFWFWKLDLV